MKIRKCIVYCILFRTPRFGTWGVQTPAVDSRVHGVKSLCSSLCAYIKKAQVNVETPLIGCPQSPLKCTVGDSQGSLPGRCGGSVIERCKVHRYVQLGRSMLVSWLSTLFVITRTRYRMFFVIVVVIWIGKQNYKFFVIFFLPKSN